MEWLVLMGGVLLVGYFLGKSDKSGREVSTPDPVKSVQSGQFPKKLNVKHEEIDSINLSDEQSEIFNLLETTNNAYYVTGKAGTGKSILLKYFVTHTGKRVVVVAPTGVAALNIGGQTIHSLFKMPFDIDFNDIKVDYRTRELLRNIDTVVIDEVSMVRADLMEAMNIKLQISRGNTLPFGDVQMIMFGDLYQLPPVVSDGELQRYLNHKFGGHYFFNAPSINKANLQTYELKKVFRQKDAEFIRILDAVRRGVIKEIDLEALNERSRADKPTDGYVTLAGTNETVSYINHKNLDKLPGEEKVYEAEIWGDITENSFPTEKKLRLKIGAQIMMLKNDTEKPRRWVNGTLGVITKLSQDVVRVNIDGVEHTITPANWDKIQYEYDPDNRELNKKVVSSFKQLPLRLAWAITIHKSQGQTYKTIAIDLTGGAFAHGQTYVALSRCVSLEGIYLNAPIKKEDIIVDPDIIEFMSKAVVLN
ncbi:MAG TPA: PIF1 family ATP-dependent DNA helicase [Candidatus Woesebacteria bacterium]|nr:PIF1 family ATP-dependent DNA helicase [Candidatus Woesebacteria bacterium]